MSAVLLLVFGALFASADIAFGALVDRSAARRSSGASVARLLLLFPVLVVALAGAAFLRAAPPSLAGLTGPARRPAGSNGPSRSACSSLLFLAFVLVQLTVLFGGTRHVLGAGRTDVRRVRPRRLLAAARRHRADTAGDRGRRPAGRRGPTGDRVLIRVLLGALAALTLVIVATALLPDARLPAGVRLHPAAGLRLRASSSCSASSSCWSLAAGVRLRAAWLPRAVVAVGVLALLGLAVLNPDRFIADRNVDRYAARPAGSTSSYLSTLSADAVPAFDRLTEPSGLRAVDDRGRPDRPARRLARAQRRPGAGPRRARRDPAGDRRAAQLARPSTATDLDRDGFVGGRDCRHDAAPVTAHAGADRRPGGPGWCWPTWPGRHADADAPAPSWPSRPRSARRWSAAWCGPSSRWPCGSSLVVAIGLGGLPLLFAVAPAVGRVTVFGVNLPWLLLGVAAFPFLFAVGWAYVRLAERNEQDFTDLVRRPER